jgi:hypothetical protein
MGHLSQSLLVHSTAVSLRFHQQAQRFAHGF